MAKKIIETENGQIIEKTSKQVKTERRVRKVQKYISTVSLVAVFFAVSSICAFATEDNAAPEGVKTDTMNSLADIIWWVVRIAVVGAAIPSVIKIVQGQADGDARERNSGIATVLIAAAIFGATFAIETVLGL